MFVSICSHEHSAVFTEDLYIRCIRWKKNKMKTDVLMAFTAVSVNSVKK